MRNGTRDVGDQMNRKVPHDSNHHGFWLPRPVTDMIEHEATNAGEGATEDGILLDLLIETQTVNASA